MGTNKRVLHRRIRFCCCVIIALLLFPIHSCAQLSKFEGTWKHKNVIIYGEQSIPLYRFFKISLDNGNVSIRCKDYHRDLTGNEIEEYYKIRDIVVKGDNQISCKAFFPPNGESRYADEARHLDYSPNTHSKFDDYEEYEIYEMSINNGVLIIRVKYLIQNFYLKRKLVDSNAITRGYDFDCYNEKDHW